MSTLRLFICCFIAITGVNATAQKPDCLVLDSSQTKLYLNGDNFTLIDNALRTFKLNSIGEQQDSLIRIWILEDNYPDTPTTWRVKMFEFGKKDQIPVATLNLLEWGYKNDNILFVKCIKQVSKPPIKGWPAVEKDVRRLNLPKLYINPFMNKGIVMVDGGMLIIQFLFGHTTYSVDFTGLLNVSTSATALQLDHSKRIAHLIWLIEKHFSIKFSVDSKGRDFLEEAKRRLNPK